MKSDIIIEGDHARILKELVSEGYYASHAEAFFDSVMIGLLQSEKSEITVGSEQAEVSRVWLNNSSRAEFKELVNIFANLESYFQEMPLTLNDIFLDEEGTDDGRKIQEFKEYAYYGIEQLGKKILDNRELKQDYDLYEFILNNLQYKEEIQYLHHNEENEKNNDEIEEIMKKLL